MLFVKYFLSHRHDKLKSVQKTKSVNIARVHQDHNDAVNMGKTWFAVEAKTFEISIEVKNKKLRGCIWERCKGATSWVRFGDSSLQRLLLGIEDCEMISRNQEWFAKWEEEGRSYKMERRSNKAGDFLLCSVCDSGRKSFGLCIPEGRGLVRGWKIMAEKLRSLGVETKRLERQKTNDSND